MRKIVNSVFILMFSAVALMSSCAKEVEVTNDEQELASLRAWIKINRPDMVEQEDGLFVKYHRFNPNLTNDPSYTYNDWYEVTYRARMMNGNYYYNSYKAYADTLGTFDYFTHYVPQKINYFTASYNLSLAQSIPLEKMYSYDSVEIYATSKYCYNGSAINSSTISGFAGNASLLAGTPAYITMKLQNVINDINKYERDEVRRYALSYMNKGSNDTVPDVSLMYMQTLVANPEGDTISKDTTVEVRYTAQFLDGFVLDTNIEDVAKKNNIYTASTDGYQPLSVTYSSSESDGGTIKGFRECVKKMRVGETAKTVFTSTLGYGSNGSSAGKTNIQPYTPLVFTIEVLKPDTTGDE